MTSRLLQMGGSTSHRCHATVDSYKLVTLATMF